MSKNFKGSNFKYGLQIDVNGDGNLTDERFPSGMRTQVTFAPISAATIPTIFFIAPAPCKVISVTERHVTVAGQAGTMTVEKVPSGTAIGSGTDLMASAFDLTSTANTNVTKDASSTLSTRSLAKGDSLAGKVASGAATSYAGGVITATIEWL